MNLGDIAAEAGVSAATVSRVLNEDSRISEKTAGRVQAVIDRLGYVPPERRKRKSRSLPAGITHNRVGLFVPDSRDIASQSPLTSMLLDGVCSVLGQKKIELQFLKLESDGSVPACITDGKLDGVVCKNWPKDEAVIRKLSSSNPVWCLGTPKRPEVGDRVEVDADEVADLAVDFATAKGCCRLALLDAQNGELPQMVRARAMGRRAESVPLPMTDHAVNSEEAELVERALTDVLKKKGKPAIVLDSADRLYTAVTMALLQRGLQIGKDVELICIAPSKGSLPGLPAQAAVIDMCIRDLGACAAEMLLWRLANPDARARRTLIQPAMMRTQ